MNDTDGLHQPRPAEYSSSLRWCIAGPADLEKVRYWTDVIGPIFQLLRRAPTSTSHCECQFIVYKSNGKAGKIVAQQAEGQG